MYYDLTKGKISKNLILFALPMMAGNLLHCDFCSCMYLCSSTDVFFCQCQRNCSYRFRCTLSPYRRIFLLWDWMSVPAVWLLSCRQETWHVRRPDCHLTRNPRGSGLSPVRIYRRNRYLDGNSDRMDSCRHYRTRLYEIP